jgi:ubiquinone/menaquinone biosynthesis C-methylase UbiE
MTDLPNLNLDASKGDKYIGYDKPGKYYEGKNYLECDGYHKACAEKISFLAGNGVFLDLACGGGSYSVPVLLNGTRVIAADISSVMLNLLKDKVLHNNADNSLHNKEIINKITICRMNAYELPISDNSVDCAMANSMLHLLSNPQRVIDELYRVIKPGGCLILGVNSPAIDNKISDELREINKKLLKATNDFHHTYWKKANEMGYSGTRYSWKFDQFADCKDKFSKAYDINIDFHEKSKTTLKDGFLYRMGGKGYSDQQGIPDDIHEKIFAETLDEMKKAYSEDFENIEETLITDGITLHVFEK